MNKYSKFTESFWEFRIPEVVMFLIVIALNIAFFILNNPEILTDINNLFNSPLFPAIPIGSIVFYIFFIIDHSRSIIMNRGNNTFCITDKMLFFDVYKIKTEVELDEILSANVIINTERLPNDTIMPKISETYNIVVKTSNRGTIKLFEYNSLNPDNYNKWCDVRKKINNFLNSDENYLQINQNPFLFRLISLLPLLICVQMIADSWK